MEPNRSEEQLSSWKEIGAYLQRNEATARRWEREEGLPVHRHAHSRRSSVYAYPSEIDAWRVSRKVVADPPPAKPLWRLPALAATALMCLIMVGNGIRPVSAQQVRGTLAKRLLCADCPDPEADFSPDGRLMVLTDWDSGDIAIRDMSTGKTKRLLVKSGTWKDSDVYAETPVLSPDLRQIAYLWGLGKREDSYQLRVVLNEAGAKPRVLVDNPENRYYEQPAWSPDSKSVITIVYKRDGTEQLARVSVSDGTLTVLKSLDRRWSRGRPNFSPDGRYLVYDALAVNPTTIPPSPSDPKNRRIYVLAADGSSETEIVKTVGLNQNPVWTPDGKHILFISDRSGKFDLWSVAVQNGKPAGPEKLVSSEIGEVYAIGVHDNAYYYLSRQTEAEYVNIAEFSPNGNNPGRVIHPTESFVGIRPTWSPDGKSIGFKRHHPASADDYDVVVRSLETGDERMYLGGNLGTTAGFAGPGWSHDGKSIMTGNPHDSQHTSYHIDLRTGDITLLPAAAAGPCARSADLKTQYCVRNDPKDWAKLPAGIVAVDVSNMQEKPLFTLPEPGYSGVQLTPDGRALVGSLQDQKTQTTHFYRLNVDGTGYREIYTIAQKQFNGNSNLTKDGRCLLVAKRNEDKNWELIRIPIEGGAPEFTGVVLDATLYSAGLDLSPDGSRIAYTTSKRIREFRALDNVLSALK